MEQIADVTAADLDQYAADVAALEATASYRSALLVEVRRLWSYRSLLPEAIRLPEAPPWAGEDPSDLLGGSKRPRENRTARIATDTMDMLLMWCLRFVESFSFDIIKAHQEYLRLWGRSPSVRNRKRGYAGNYTSSVDAQSDLRTWLNKLQQVGEGLPSKIGPSGIRQVDWPHLCRVLDVGDKSFNRASGCAAYSTSTHCHSGAGHV